jgi:ATP-dependent Lhr-like helicase
MFHPLVSSWFERRYGSPTDIQARAWPEIAAGGHVLVAAPTGSGKTMTAFLHAIDRMITDDVSSGGVRVLYISPLKALNNDIRRNLLAPLEELKEEFLAACMDFPPVNVSVRSGDTPPEERRRMLKRPPEILITTPESLNILLTSAGGRTLFSGLELVIMDEIHAVFDSKRGTHLITAVERLTLIAGEFQRIALSATVNPLAAVADFIGGLRPAGGHYEKRPVAIISSSGAKRFALSVIFPEEAPVNPEDGTRWPALVELFRGIISDNSSTLFFANSRRMVEKIARFINEDQAEEIAFSHHGSLSREIRLLVEEKLKGGEIRGIVATNSLELGIDIGRCDRVVMIQAPQSVSSAVQKLGRSGHGVGEVSRGCIVPTHGRDFIDSAVMARCVMERDIEEKKAVMAPLDVLAQVILSMTSVEPWNIDELYAFMLRCHPYRDLKRRHFDLVVDMLEGRYADSRIRELTPRISVDRIDNMAQAREGAAYHLYSSGGTIPDRGYYDMRVAGTKSRIGELDEEFVWERSAGDTFSMGTQAWRIQNITHNEVEVASVRTRPGMIPFWKGEESNRGSHFMERVAAFLEEAEGLVADEEAFRLRLMERYFMEGPAARELSDFCLLQRKSTGSPLPHRHHLLVERFSDPANRSDTSQLLLHTLWGGKINAPFSMALAEAWEEKYGYRLEVIYNNDALLLILPHDFSSSLLFDLVTEDNLEPLLRRRLEKTGSSAPGSGRTQAARFSFLLPDSGNAFPCG